MEAVLTMLAAAAKAHHDSAGKSCGTAVAVPTTIPAGNYYAPGFGADVDFHTGDDQNGWECLDVVMPPVVHCRYSYTRGNSPVATSVNAPSVTAGADDFEVAAEGDADGDGEKSAYSIIGVVGQDGQLAVHPMYTYQPLE